MHEVNTCNPFLKAEEFKERLETDLPAAQLVHMTEHTRPVHLRPPVRQRQGEQLIHRHQDTLDVMGEGHRQEESGRRDSLKERAGGMAKSNPVVPASDASRNHWVG